MAGRPIPRAVAEELLRLWNTHGAENVKQLLEAALTPQQPQKTGGRPAIDDPLEIVDILCRVVMQDLDCTRQEALRVLVIRADPKAPARAIQSDTERLR